MLKKFLKFLGGDSDDSEELEESYLQHLLDEVEPRVVDQLEETPKHDPLLLVIAELLRETSEERFDDDIDGPLVDRQTRADEETRAADPPEPPSPPGSGGDEAPDFPEPPAPPGSDDQTDEESEEDESEGTEEGEEADTEEAEEAESEGADTEGADREVAEESTGDEQTDEEASGDDGDDTEPAEEDEADGEATDGEAEEEGTADEETADAETDEERAAEEDDAADDEEEPADVDEADDAAEEEKTDDVEAESVGGPADEEPEEPSPDATLEAEPKEAGESGSIGLAEETDAGRPELDSEIVLEMGRVLLGMLAENDRLPLEIQMGPRELDDAQQLLQGYFLAEGDVEEQAQEMLQRVEEKFNDGLFSQAEILLRLFDSDRATRIENDRNLFYEEMILRFGIERRHPVGDDIREELDDRLVSFGDDPGELGDLLRWVSETLFVTFDVYGRDEDQLERWREIADRSSRPGATERLLEVIPPRRWRLLDEFSSPVIDLLDEQLSAEYVGNYVIEHVKTCYFVLRAVGDTGLEPYLDVFFDWVDEEFDVDGTALMPWIYEETTANERLIDDIFAELYRDHFEEKVEAQRAEWDEDDLEEAVGEMLGRFGATDLDDVPPGHYDFGRFVLDELFEVEYPTDDFPYKMHRLV